MTPVGGIAIAELHYGQSFKMAETKEAKAKEVNVE
jgi:hypothetical protein